jgi:LMBR1 domain-containing protein 1
LKKLNRFRFFVLIHSLRDIPQDIDLSRSYYLEYGVFD